VVVEDNQKAKRLSGYLGYLQTRSKLRGPKIEELINESDGEEDIVSEFHNLHKMQALTEEEFVRNSSEGFEELLSQFTLRTEIICNESCTSDIDDISMYSLPS